MEGKMARRPSGSSDIGVDSEEDAAARNNRDASPDIDEQTNDDDEDPTHHVEVLAGSAPMSTDIYTTNARDGLNLRSGPGTDFPIIRSLPFGTQVHLIRREGRWGLIDEQGDGATDGFVHLAFLDQAAADGGRAGATLAEDEVRAFWAARNPRGAKLYNSAGRPLVDPQLLHSSALGAVKLESLNPNHRIELYGPSGGFRTSGSTGNHGAQPGTGRGAAMDFVIIDRTTGRMLTNHPGANHQNQGTVGENAPSYQIYFNEVVRAGSQIYPRFAEKARFGGYFASSNPMDTMHIDLRGPGRMGGGSLRGGFTPDQMETWNIPENHPFR
jgi:Bacterial SH3 domain